MAQKVLWVFGYTEKSGYARNSREWIKALNKNGIETRFIVHENAKDYPDEAEMKPYESYVGYDYDLVIFNTIPPSFDRKWLPKKHIKHILMTVAETDSVSSAWVEKCNEADEVWTMSYFSKCAFVHSGVTVPVQITLMPIDIEKIRTAKSKQFEMEKDSESFVFFANSEWTPRKGWDILLEAYYNKFRNEETATLLIKTGSLTGVENYNTMRNMALAYRNKYGGDRVKCSIVLIADMVPIEDVWYLYKCADAYVLPSRGEGCGIPYLEAMACGKPVIAPDRGGQVDYILPGTGELVKSIYRRACRFPHNPNYDESMLWIETDPTDLMNKMYEVFSNRMKYSNRAGFEAFDAIFGQTGAAVRKTIERIKAI